MEPLILHQREGCAPIMGWSDPSPGQSPVNIKSTSHQNISVIKPSHVSPTSSSSSGIDLDILDKSSIKSASVYTPTISSIYDEPIFQSSQSILGDHNETLNKKIDYGDPKNTPILRCGNPKLKLSFHDSLANVNKDEHHNEGVKFVGIHDNDSICSTSFYDDELDDVTNNKDGKPKIPDGGWGWMVVFASLILSMIADGISFSFGLLYVEFLNHFGESHAKTSWIGGLFMSVPLMSGPIMSALVDKFGCRNMTILGGIVSCAGFIMASMSNSVEMMLLTFGTIAGLGLGMVYVTAIVSVAYWFDKKRTLAVGLGSCGTGIGTFIYAPMTQYFIEEFGWRGTLLLLSGTLLNMCVCGAVMRDPEWWILEQKNQQSGQSTKSLRGTSSCGSVSRLSGGAESTFPGIDELRMLMKSGETPEYILTTLATSIAVAEKLEETPNSEANKDQLYNSVVNLPTFIRRNEKVPLEVLELLSSNKKLYHVILENYPSLLSCRSCSENKLNAITIDKQSTIRMPITMSMKLKTLKKGSKDSENPDDEVKSKEMANSPLLPLELKPSTIPPAIKPPSKPTEPWFKRQFPANQHYLKHIRMHRNSVMHRGAMMNIAKYRLRASSCPNIYRNSMIYIPHEEEKWYSETIDVVKSMFDFKMFLEFHFLLTSLSTLILFISFIVPYFYITKHLMQNGYTEDDGAMQISIIGVANTIGMIFLGWAGDRPWMNVTKTYSVCLVGCGIATLAYPFVTHSYYLLVITSALFGLLFASSFSFIPVILVELIPLERFTTAYGLILLSQGIGNLIGPPLAGWIYDMIQTWELCFYLAGVLIIISGILIAIIPITKNFRIWGSAPLEKDLEKISQMSQKDSISIA